ncbi:MAG: TRAP transporter large permease subunit [Armatimonadetes bacterium]|nr:TRAP transporter large permease subunit [Armatimonadota bacterium]
MDIFTISIAILAFLVLFLGSTVWIGISLFIVGILAFTLFTGSPPLTILSNILWNNTSNSTMIALPLFIFMGEIFFRSNISQNMFKGLSPWMEVLPGRLIHVNIIACALFAAVSGSSAATTATVGKITLPELLKRNYNRALCIGSLAGAGTLGFLIPPSLIMLVYGIVADVSIGKLFIGGIIPGIMLASAFSGFVFLRCVLKPDLAPRGNNKHTWNERIKSIPLVLPVIALITMVLGSLYLGWATPTEAATVGVLGSLLFAVFSRSIDKRSFFDAVLSSVRTSCMIMLIVCGASYLSVAVGYLGIPGELTKFVGTLGLSKYSLIAIMTILYIILGCMLDGFSIIVMTLPLALPLIKAVGLDPLWFGIYLVIMIEIAQITPPVGFNLFVINGLIDEDMLNIAKYALPSFLLMLFVVAIITVYPKIVLTLPNMMIK